MGKKRLKKQESRGGRKKGGEGKMRDGGGRVGREEGEGREELPKGDILSLLNDV